MHSRTTGHIPVLTHSIFGIPEDELADGDDAAEVDDEALVGGVVGEDGVGGVPKHLALLKAESVPRVEFGIIAISRVVRDEFRFGWRRAGRYWACILEAVCLVLSLYHL